jgi:hypothetical protein
MTDSHVTAAEFMHLVYEKIKHGDEAHQKWLKDECFNLIADLEKRLIELVAKSWSTDDAKEVAEAKRSLNELTLAFIEGRAGYPSREIDAALAKRLEIERQKACNHCECPEAHDG